MNINEKRRLNITVLLILISFLFAHSCFILLPNIFETWNKQAVDQFFIFRSNSEHLRPCYNDTIVHVDLNNTSIRLLNNFYLNRYHHAQVIRNLSAMGVSAQLYDFIFAAKSSEEEDKELIDATFKSGRTYYGLAFELLEEKQTKCGDLNQSEAIKYLDKTKWQGIVQNDSIQFYVGSKPLATFDDLASACRGLGYLNLRMDHDGVFRRAPLLVRYNGAFYPSLPFRAICDYLNIPPEKIIIKSGNSITLTGARLPGDSEARDIVIPIDSHGNMVVNFIGPWERMKHYNFVDVLRASEDREEMEMWKEEFSGKIVIISDVTTGSSDMGSVPTDTYFPLSGFHTNVMHTILTESFLRELSRLEMLIIELSLLIFILLMAYYFSSPLFSLGAIALGGCYICCAAGFFFYTGIIFHVIRPLLIVAFALVSVVVYRHIREEKDKEVLQKTFEAYFPPSIVKKIMSNPQMISTGGQKEELTILFSDIVEFTRQTSAMEPSHIQYLLNEYFEAMTEIVFNYHGTVDKFIGDGMMVFFGNPDPQPDHALRCVKAAIEMQKKVREIKMKWEEHGEMPIKIRIGIHTGTVVVGNMGSPKRLSYTVLGPAVNLAQRLESKAPVEGILISHSTYNYVKDHVPASPLEPIKVKGFDEFISVYEVSLVESGVAS